MTLYQKVTEKQLLNFLKKLDGTNLYTLNTQEIKTDTLFGDFIIHKGYKFKKIYSDYQCLETPVEKHIPQTISVSKNPNDSRNWK